MERATVAILGTRYENFSLEEEVLAPLGVSLVSGDGGSPEEIWQVAATADVVLAGSRPRFTSDVLDRLSCRGIVRYGIGTDSIDLAAARRRGITVARVSDYGADAVAFHAVAMAIAQLRRLTEADRSMRAGLWTFAELRPLHEPSALVAGIIGYGRIGRRSGALMQGLGMRVCAHDPYLDIAEQEHIQLLELVDLLHTSDVVLLHAPGSADAKPLLDAGMFSHMRPGSVLVNTARGSLIDLLALVAALRVGRPARAALDVYPDEPPDISVFADVADRVLMTPHMAWYTEESEADLRRKAAAEVVRILRGRPLVDPVVEGGASG